MGGSLALRLKQNNLCQSVVGLVRRPESVTQAQALGAVDWATVDPVAAFRQADIVILATPVRILLKQLAEYAPLFKSGCIITELGSTKALIMEAMTKLPAHVHPIGSHPMCGKEVSGLTAAESTLYENATWVITPLERTPTQVVQIIDELARSVGANPLHLAAERHDHLVAAISHMPYLLSTALVLAAQSVAAEDDKVWHVAASGFRDTSRIAASDVAMMMDILLTNRPAVAEMVGLLRHELDTLAELLQHGDEVELRQRLTQAHDQRRALY
jgi:prephenate dehydrogenase